MKENNRIILLAVGIYMLGKFLMRPIVLSNNSPELLNIFVYSLPNFCEAVIGVLLLTNILLVTNAKLLRRAMKPIVLYFSAVVISAVYVILQEFKIHNLGGNNIYDPNDVIFSIIGLCTAFIYVLVRKPSFKL